MLTIVAIIMAIGFIIGVPVAFTLGVAAVAYFLASPHLSPTMKEEGDDAQFSAAVTGAASTIGPIFPTIILLLIGGYFLNPSALIIIFIPLLMPVMNSVRMYPIFFGVVSTLALMIGNMTPPFGLCMFIVCDIAKVSVKQLAVASIPFYIVLVVALLTMIFIPQTVTYLPDLLFR